jgi:hypothetical protein
MTYIYVYVHRRRMIIHHIDPDEEDGRDLRNADPLTLARLIAREGFSALQI